MTEETDRVLQLNQTKNSAQKESNQKKKPVEVGGRKGLEPTRYGDWEKNGRCIDF